MGSISKVKREEQKEIAEKALAACTAKLAEAGVSEKEMARHPSFRQAKAALKKANLRLKAIEERAEHIKNSIENKEKNKMKAKPKATGKAPAKGKEKSAKPEAKAKPKKKK